MTVISSEKIYNGILLGAKSILENREELNKTNKFPVPDNDTGDNLYYLMSRIRKNLSFYEDMDKTLSQASDLAIINSRGNSGAIFSQFFVGVEKGLRSVEKIRFEDLIHSFELAYEHSYNSISSPIVDGTILIAIKTWSESLRNNYSANIAHTELFEQCFEDLNTVVRSKKYQKIKGVIDAGALAFLYFIEGFMSSVVYGKKDDHVELKDDINLILEDDVHEELEHQQSAYRFCTEVLLKKKAPDFDASEFEKLGDCLVVSSNANYLKIHVHTDRPYELVRLASKHGEIIESKCEDMKIQSIISRKGKIALLIDSIADIPKRLFTDYTYMLPVNILLDDISYKDKRTVCEDVLSGATKATSSQPSTEEMKRVLSKLLIGYEQVIILTVSSKMSGIYNQYERLLPLFETDRIKLIDTRQNSVSEGLVVHKALELISQNSDVDYIVSELQKTARSSTILVSLSTLDQMVASGRLGSKIGSVLKAINFLPIITIDKEGEGKIYNFSFSRARNNKKLIAIAKKYKDSIENYAFVHCGSENEVKKVAGEIEQILGFPPAYVTRVSSVIYIFSGDNTLAFGYTRREG